MPFLAAMRSHHPARAGLVWMLLLALVVYGCNGVVVQLLGPKHFHRSPDASAPGPVTGSPGQRQATSLHGPVGGLDEWQPVVHQAVTHAVYQAVQQALHQAGETLRPLRTWRAAMQARSRAAGIALHAHPHAGADRGGHGQARHDQARHEQAGHEQAGHEQAGHSHAGHDHGSAGRHHHAVADTSVIALDASGPASEAAADGAAGAAHGSATLPFGLGFDVALPAPAGISSRWPHPGPQAWVSAPARLLERPPRS